MESNTGKVTEEALSVIEHEELETLIITCTKNEVWIDEVLNSVQDSLEENISREKFW